MRHGRRSRQLVEVLVAIAFALAGRAGARLARQAAITVSRSTLLRVLRAAPAPKGTTPRVLGVDDFALYGTVLVDMTTGKPIDLLADRKAETLRDWLVEHSGVEIVCRDRAGAYAEGARAGAPEAVQVADRWHLWHNLGEAVERAVTRHHACLREPVAEDEQATVTTPVVAALVRESRLVVRTQQRYAAVQERLAAGCSISQISRELDLERGTVHRFARAGSLDELLVKTTTRETQIDGFEPYLQRRWNEGCMNATRLYDEIRAQGFSGVVQIVRRYLRRLRTTPAAPASQPTQLKARQVTTWIMQEPNSLEAGEQESLQRVLDRCPELNALAGHLRAFAEMMRDLRGERLARWMDDVQADDLPDLHSLRGGRAPRSGRRRRRLDTAVELRASRRARQPAQDAQAPDVWTRQVRSPPPSRPRDDVTSARVGQLASSKVGQNPTR